MNTAKDILRKHIPPPKNEGEKNDDVNIIKAMEEYASQPKWISVEERLPKIGQSVLVLTEDESGNEYVERAHLEDSENMYWRSNYIVPGKVLKWQPLPTPPTK